MPKPPLSMLRGQSYDFQCSEYRPESTVFNESDLTIPERLPQFNDKDKILVQEAFS